MSLRGQRPTTAAGGNRTRLPGCQVTRPQPPSAACRPSRVSRPWANGAWSPLSPAGACCCWRGPYVAQRRFHGSGLLSCIGILGTRRTHASNVVRGGRPPLVSIRLSTRGPAGESRPRRPRRRVRLPGCSYYHCPLRASNRPISIRSPTASHRSQPVPRIAGSLSVQRGRRFRACMAMLLSRPRAGRGP